MRLVLLAAGAALAGFINVSHTTAQQNAGGAAAAPDGGWFEGEKYAESAYSGSGSYEPPTPLQIIQQKAQRRAAARIRRIETLNAYGMSNARPTANATPYSGMYSPAWQMPGGRPFGWFTNRAPQYILWR